MILCGKKIVIPHSNILFWLRIWPLIFVWFNSFYLPYFTGCSPKYLISLHLFEFNLTVLYFLFFFKKKTTLPCNCYNVWNRLKILICLSKIIYGGWVPTTFNRCFFIPYVSDFALLRHRVLLFFFAYVAFHWRHWFLIVISAHFLLI